LLENTFDRKRVSDNPITLTVTLTLTQTLTLPKPLTLTLKHNNVFGLTKWRYFSRKCTIQLLHTILFGTLSEFHWKTQLYYLVLMQRFDPVSIQLMLLVFSIITEDLHHLVLLKDNRL